MRIVFLLPGSGEFPVGGFRVVYHYADGLAANGHDVAIAHPAFLRADRKPLKMRLREHGLNYLKRARSGSWRPDSWFKFKNPVRLLWIPALAKMFIPKADIYVATFWLTAEHLARWNVPGKKLYLIQHYETYAGPPERVDATWKAPLQKIVISKWLEDIAASFGETARIIPNGLDHISFGCDIDNADRRGSAVAMMSHPAEWKGTADGIEALKRARESVGDLTAEVFGVSDPPPGLPSWITYRRNPTQADLRDLYNRAAIFVAPSWAEGWGLPASEAMMCGTAVVATDIGGHREFCEHGVTALLAPAKSPDALAARIVQLVTDRSLRVKIAQRGHDDIRKFNWDSSLAQFEEALHQAA
jgi:glycosyltransferase involved in cell wall biosynthesis